MTTTEVKR